MKMAVRYLLAPMLSVALPVVAQPVDSLMARADGPAQTLEERVRIWHTLLRDRSVTTAELDASPVFRAALRDTVLDNAWAWLLAGSTLHREASFDGAARAFARSMDSFKDAGNEEGLAWAGLALAWSRSMVGDQSVAMRGAFDALSILQRTGSETEEAQAMLLLAFIFRYQEDHPKALVYYRKVDTIAQRTNDAQLRVDALRGEAGVLLEQDHNEEAMAMYQEALSLCREKGFEQRIPILHVEMANVNVKLGDLARAQREFQDALVLFERRRNNTWTSYTLARLAEVAHALGDHRNALVLAERGYAMARQLGLMKETLDNLFILPPVCAALGRYADALTYSLTFEAINDSMRNDAMRTEMGRLELRQEEVRDSLARAEERNRERIAFEANVSSARMYGNITLISGLGVMLLVGGLWTRLRRMRQLKQELAAGNVLVQQEVGRAERSEKVKEQFLANMSHEIRTPMNAIMGMTAILRRNERLPTQERYLDAIAQSSSNLLVILNDILDLGKLEAGTVEIERLAMDPRSVIGNVLDILRFKAEEKGLLLDAQVADDVPHRILGDPTRLNQILLNLVGNAIKFTEHGCVTVEAASLSQKDHGLHNDAAAPLILRFRVRDTGIGIGHERIPKIFEEFIQAYSDTTRKYGGTGLGLTITKRLIELQGGTVQVESTPGEGSTFIVDIPYDRPHEGPTAQQHPPATTARVLDGLRILLAEDNDFNVTVARDELEDAIPGVRIDVASNGREAIEKARTGSYDVILMDIQMPVMNGFEATRSIRELPGAAGRVPIIAMTANVLKSEVERCMEAGMNAFVPKPFERSELLENLRNCTTGTERP